MFTTGLRFDLTEEDARLIAFYFGTPDCSQLFLVSGVGISCGFVVWHTILELLTSMVVVSGRIVRLLVSEGNNSWSAHE